MKEKKKKYYSTKSQDICVIKSKKNFQNCLEWKYHIVVNTYKL